MKFTFCVPDPEFNIGITTWHLYLMQTWKLFKPIYPVRLRRLRNFIIPFLTLWRRAKGLPWFLRVTGNQGSIPEREPEKRLPHLRKAAGA
uniref:Uncharacterized protein n=1 Tax=Lutzomyia longipalpis TaxID=7200 RepID=A0A1B0CTR3_LUTLO